MSTADSFAPKLPRFTGLLRHPIFPLLLLIPITQIVRDNYPVSHYPMYSKPSMAESVFFFVGGPDEKPLPVKLETGISVSQVGKKYRYHKLELIQGEEKQGRRFGQLTDERIAEIEARAARETLEFLRAQSLKRRPKIDLTSELKLVQVTLLFKDEGYSETCKTLATLAPAS
jgi:hypothetical protein